jgi:osmotically-inducible protein OsmY
MGHAVRHAHGVEVSARAGTVTLAGTAAPHEVERLVRAVRAVRGVAHVVNRMHDAAVGAGAHQPD